MASDLYKELGVSRSAGADEIKKVYKKLAGQLHPDRNQGDEKVEARFKAVNRAYQVLSDPEKRRMYDEFGDESLREGFNAAAARAYRNAAQAAGQRRARGGAGMNFEDLGGGVPGGFGDLLGELFSGGRGGRIRNPHGGPPPKGADVTSEVSIDFVSAIRGAELRLRVEAGGDEVTVRVPPGAGEGDKVRVPGHGAQGMGGVGDLVITIRVKPHPFFERDGLDLHLNLPVTVAEAHRGAKVRVPTPDGPVTLSVPKHAQSGQEARLKGKGVKRGPKQGDLYVRFLVKLPAQNSEAIEQAVTTLEEAMSGDVRDGIHF
jgi:curved DNA-binding protein